MIQQVVAYGVIPLLTLLLAGEGDWFASNFSVIGNAGWGRVVFLLWGVLVGLYFYKILGRLHAKLEGAQWIDWGRKLALTLFFLSLATPYLPENQPIRGDIHVILALLATIILFIVVLSLVLTLHRRSIRGGRAYLLGMAAIGAVTFLLLAIAGMVSTALEIFLVLSNLMLLQQMERQL